MHKAARHFFVVLMLLSSVARAQVHPTPRAVEKGVINGPRAWALATTALLTYANGDRLDMLSPDDRTAAHVAQTRKILREWWAIQNRAQLLRVLDHLNQEGHRAQFQRIGRTLADMTDAQYRSALAAQSEADRVRMNVTRDHYRRRASNSLVAWDMSRYIMLCRWGYMVGFLSEYEAWRRIMPAARTIQRAFHSWAEVGEDYLAGREFWSHEEMSNTGDTYRKNLTWLLKEPTSPWNRLRWAMELGPAASR